MRIKSGQKTMCEEIFLAALIKEKKERKKFSWPQLYKTCVSLNPNK